MISVYWTDISFRALMFEGLRFMIVELRGDYIGMGALTSGPLDFRDRSRGLRLPQSRQLGISSVYFLPGL